jgi:hypothetical protein
MIRTIAERKWIRRQQFHVSVNFHRNWGSYLSARSDETEYGGGRDVFHQTGTSGCFMNGAPYRLIAHVDVDVCAGLTWEQVGSRFGIRGAPPFRNISVAAVWRSRCPPLAGESMLALMGSDRQTDLGQAVAQIRPGILECRGDRERVGEPERGRDSTRRSTFATAQQPCVRRTRPGVDELRRCLLTDRSGIRH